MNLDDLTIEDIKRIKALLTQDAVTEHAPHPFVGKYVLCRCTSAGVHAGELVSMHGEQVVLENSRRLWKWVAVAGIALSGVAQYGITEGSKVDVSNPIIAINGVIEIIPCTAKAQASINEYR